jgi:colanic acid biosynthesis glycosyl transferase WcaI
MATGQYLAEVAEALVQRGHQVTVLTGRRAYDRPETLFPRRETWRGIRIIRIGSTGFGKTAKWRRAVDFASFMSLCALRLAFMSRHDAIVALTSPPLISFLGAWVAKLRRSRFYYWVMDFNPDEAIAAGWLRAGSVSAKILESMSCFSLKRATRIIALDHFIRDRIIAKGIAANRILVVPPWSHDPEVAFDAAGRGRFRADHGLDGKFVVMYSGNHSPCHPLDTLIEAARRLESETGITFCFVGGGSELRKIQKLVTSAPAGSSRLTGAGDRDEMLTHHASRITSANPCSNLLCLPYQPLNQLSASLSAADLHVVVMGAPFVGLVHPCKLYNILNVGAPVLYIGPRPSHLTEILDAADGQLRSYAAAHGETERLVEQIRRARSEVNGQGRQKAALVCSAFAKGALLPKLITALEGAWSE